MRQSALQPVLPQALGTLAGHETVSTAAHPSPGWNSGWAVRQSALQPVLPQALGTLAGHGIAKASARSLNSGWAWDSQGFSPSFPRLLELWLGMG
uniref:Uncharacterized protein n=1 Tax=Xenopus tropicalis TaxID=8364 RepID=A0A1B8XTC1_XENTR